MKLSFLPLVAFVAGSVSAAPVQAGAISVDTDFLAAIPAGESFKADLESIGVGVTLAGGGNDFIRIFTPASFNIRLLGSLPDASGAPVIDRISIDGINYGFGLQSFTSPGTLLGVQTLSGSFSDIVGFGVAIDPLAPPIFWPDGGYGYIRSIDEAGFTGIGPFVGSVDHIYIVFGDKTLIEISAVPEPSSWAMLVAGFGLVGAVVRRRRMAHPA